MENNSILRCAWWNREEHFKRSFVVVNVGLFHKHFIFFKLKLGLDVSPGNSMWRPIAALGWRSTYLHYRQLERTSVRTLRKTGIANINQHPHIVC